MEEQAKDRGTNPGLSRDGGLHGGFHGGEESWAGFSVEISWELSIGVAYHN